MSKMISVASGFQYSVNIGYDLNNDDKLKNFIPTKSALMLLKDILSSTALDATERARVLVGAYGKGKSHIILTILSVLMQRDRSLFTHLMPKINEDPELKQLVDNYYSDKKNRILPVIINGTSGSLPQAFLLALQRTLDENGLDIMPETNYRAAINAIQKWKADYPKTYDKFKKEISLPVDAFISELNDYNAAIYSEFEEVYPKLTSGSIFNPFVGFDVVELYESVVKSLKQRGYLGIYVVYDEFSKFLESNITAASVSDTKMLQDFAEKCNRSSENELHLLLISHKEISNYIDQLPKAKVDGWRGVSERFRHIHLNNNFAQTYEIISTVIIKDRDKWEDFQDNNKARFDQLMSRYAEHAIFSDTDQKELETTIYECYPLHPVSTFILPRLSERVAQNERTLFTFLSADGTSTLPKPYCVYDFMDSFYRSSGANAGRGNYKLAQSAGALIGDTRKKIQELLHCQAKQVVFEPTATIALNIIIQGIIEKGAVNIYISPFEHNAVTRTLHHFEEQEKIKITQLTVSKGMVYDLEKIRYQFDTVKPDFVIVSHASNVFGLIAPVEDIFALAKKYEAITLVDMAQTAGLVDLNVGLTTIDFAVFAGHKTLYGPTGISGFVMNPAVKFPAVIFGGTGYESANQDMPEDLPQKYEMGTQDIAGIAGLNAALGWSAQVTIDAIRKKEAENRKKLIDLLSRYSYIKIIGNYDSCNYVGIVSCIIEGISSDSAGPVFDRCGIAVRTGLQCAPLAHQFMGTFPAGTIRFSVNYFTTDKDFAELEQALDYIDSEL